MTLRRSRQRPDLFRSLLVFVTVGVLATLAYQFNLYYGGQVVPIAEQAPLRGAPEVIDG